MVGGTSTCPMGVFSVPKHLHSDKEAQSEGRMGRAIGQLTPLTYLSGVTYPLIMESWPHMLSWVSESFKAPSPASTSMHLTFLPYQVTRHLECHVSYGSLCLEYPFLLSLWWKSSLLPRQVQGLLDSHKPNKRFFLSCACWLMTALQTFSLCSHHKLQSSAYMSVFSIRVWPFGRQAPRLLSLSYNRLEQLQAQTRQLMSICWVNSWTIECRRWVRGARGCGGEPQRWWAPPLRDDR